MHGLHFCSSSTPETPKPAREVNWFAQPDPHLCQYILDAQQIANIEARYEEDDDEWEALGGLTWVGRVHY